MPSAMSSPSEPVDIASMSIALSFLPSRMIEPLPNWRSIWPSAADRAFDLSMEDPSTRRSADWLILRAPYGRDSGHRQRRASPAPRNRLMEAPYPICSQFAICSFLGMGTYIPLEQVQRIWYTRIFHN